MALIDEKTAWEILRRFAEDCIQIDSSSLLVEKGGMGRVNCDRTEIIRY